MIDIRVPELGEGVKTATVACWHVQAGAAVKTDEDLVELVTDKATFNVPAPQDGILAEIFAGEGEEIAIGGRVAVLRPTDKT